MNITINSLQLGESTTFKLMSPVEGLEVAPIRTSQQNYSGRDGGRVNGQFYSSRLITLNGFIRGDTCQDHEEARISLQEALPIREDLDLVVESFAGAEYIATVRLLDFKMPVINNKRSDFKIDLVASDPFLYSSTSSSVEIPKELGGGFILPVILPIIFDPGTSPTVVNNNGSVIVYPTITIEGTAHNPEITKTETGEKVEVAVTMTASDVLVIDMKERTITLNGGSVLSLRSSDSDWFGLDVGVNHLTYSTTNVGDTGTAIVTWRTGVAGL